MKKEIKNNNFLKFYLRREEAISENAGKSILPAWLLPNVYLMNCSSQTLMHNMVRVSSVCFKVQWNRDNSKSKGPNSFV